MALAQAEAHFTAGVSRFARATRAQARTHAQTAAAAYVSAENQRLASIHRSLQDEAAQWWRALTGNDGEVVCDAVNSAFSDNPAAGCAVGVSGSTLSIVMRLPDLDSLPTQQPGTTPAGRPTLKALPKRDRMRWWLHMLASNLAAAVLEAFATAPAITEVAAAVITRMPDTQRLGVVAYGSWSRAAVEGSTWRTADDAWRIFDIGTDVQCSIRSTASGNISSVVKPLQVDDVPALASLLDDCVDEPDTVLGQVDSGFDDADSPIDGPADLYAPIPFVEWLARQHQQASPAPIPPVPPMAPTVRTVAPQRPPIPAPAIPVAAVPPVAGIELQRGQNVALPDPAQSELHVEFRFSDADADLAILLVDGAGHVLSDDDFLFYNNPVARDGTVRLLGKTGGPDGVVESAVIYPRASQPEVRRIVVAASMDVAAGLTFAAIRRPVLTVRGPTGDTWSFVPPAEPTVRAFVLLEVYLRELPDGGTQWKLRAVGQGWDEGLAALARAFGVDVDD
ncbi:MAG: TerD family protein [Gordonia sp. (in: high G+C Gram-positive bacteria)]|uniref:TerD family protein n=1 Tax=Gordonia sp. (in: high G+C Gram-positive bacteria) TaxID=84139 RepID=UPI0039E21F9C